LGVPGVERALLDARGMKPFAITLAVVATLALAGCSVDPTPADDTDDITSTSITMPKAIVDYEAKMGWGTHHLRWHTERQWNLLDPSDRDYAKGKGWAPAKIQEGAKGNGLEFLAMHRVMIRTLVSEFPKYKALFAGWTHIPTDPKDKSASPKPTEAFDSNMLAAIDKLENHVGDFASDDDFGLYLETKLRPTKASAGNRTTDKTAGIHNYVHNRFMDSGSKIDLGDPSVNLQNKVFWRLHGWIDARWTAFRAAKGLTDADPAYKAALQAAEDEMMSDMPKLGGPKGIDPAPPDSLTKFFEEEAP
jgi:hypothetical protein